MCAMAREPGTRRDESRTWASPIPNSRDNADDPLAQLVRFAGTTCARYRRVRCLTWCFAGHDVRSTPRTHEANPPGLHEQPGGPRAQPNAGFPANAPGPLLRVALTRIRWPAEAVGVHSAPSLRCFNDRRALAISSRTARRSGVLSAARVSASATRRALTASNAAASQRLSNLS